MSVAARKLDPLATRPLPQRVDTLETLLTAHIRSCRRTMLRVEGLVWAIASAAAYHMDWAFLLANMGKIFKP